MRKIRIFEHMLAGRRDRARRALRVWRMDDAVSKPGGAASASSKHTARTLICCSAAAPTISGRLLAEGRRQSDGRQPSTPPRNTSRLTGRTPRMGSGQGSGRGHHRRDSRPQVKDGPDLIVWGSSTLTSVLLDHGLVDEVCLIVYPVLLGRGKRFFSDSVGRAQTRFRQLEGHAHGRAREHVSIRWSTVIRHLRNEHRASAQRRVASRSAHAASGRLPQLDLVSLGIDDPARTCRSPTRRSSRARCSLRPSGL